MAYANIEPFGPVAEDYRAGQVCAAVANFAGKVIPNDRAPMTAADFMVQELEEPDQEEGDTPASAQQEQGMGMDLEMRSRLIESVVFGKGQGNGDTR